MAATDSPGRATQFDRFFRVHVAHPVENGAQPRADKSQFRERNHADLGCPDLRTKIFSFRKIRNCVLFPPSRRDKGRVAIVTNVGCGMRWTQRCR
jgi:hypothetical protein